jgi:hypothetical protein
VVGIDLGRANVKVRGFQSRPFGCEVGSQFHQRHVSRGPPIIPDGRIFQVKCARAHLTCYVVSPFMWRQAGKALIRWRTTPARYHIRDCLQ